MQTYIKSQKGDVAPAPQKHAIDSHRPYTSENHSYGVGECPRGRNHREAILQRASNGLTLAQDVLSILPGSQRLVGQPMQHPGSETTESHFEYEFSGVQVQHEPRMTTTLGAWLPQVKQGFPSILAETSLYYPSEVADNFHVHALTMNESIHLGTSARHFSRTKLDTLLAHEAVHRLQQSQGREQGHVSDLEIEAHALGPKILTNRPVNPRFYSRANVPLMDTPHDRMVVERARRRLALLNRYVDEWTTREARRLGTAEERDRLLERRRRMDAESSDIGEALRPGQRARIETQNLANLNQRPLNIAITNDEVRFTVNFHVRFEDVNMRNRYNELHTNLQRGIDLVWNQRLGGLVFGDRRFSIMPRVTQVTGSAARDQNYWLITVRPRDNSPITYPGCTLDQPPAGVTAAVTDPNCAGGIMNLPPAAIADSSVIGHELLHLFGLVDRYMMLTQQLPRGRSRTVSSPTRDTRGRPDPLGGESGTILTEDLAFLFDRLGVYRMEENRGLDLVRQLERQGLSITAVRAEIHRLEEIIRLGRDPNSLIREREDFNDRMERDIENL